ncbi:E3 ubiquitin-protein ligase TRIM38 [Hyalella azteca]|uniref:E3 ubiquitin-protein ligase TRIM38 n=1 Tax=Hyalella azteca TaxID=294128 RepID=A0A8B7P181_HYAAZ|nr:E3 ubiquitin-protein ligase TRIM38 [Hyalella azteca]
MEEMKYLECSVCNETYNDSDHRPISLPCGHVFCGPCLHQVEENNELRRTEENADTLPQCPSCREPWDGESARFPVCYMLIPNDADIWKTAAGENQDGVCPSHRVLYEFWCSSCSQAFCKKCLKSHRNHCTILPADLLEGEFNSDLQKSNFFVNGEEVIKSIDEAVRDCDSALQVMRKIRAFEREFQLRKKNLEKQRQNLKEAMNLMKNYIKEESFDVTCEKLWNFFRMKSHGDVLCETLENNCRRIIEQTSDLKGSFEKAEAALQARIIKLMPSEFLPNNSEWDIRGEYAAQKAMATLRNSNNKPQGCVTVWSTASEPVQHLSLLLVQLAEAGCAITLHLLDSFWSRESPPTDCHRLEPFLQAGHGHALHFFHGYVKASTLQAMTSLQYIGLLVSDWPVRGE